MHETGMLRGWINEIGEPQLFDMPQALHLWGVQYIPLDLIGVYEIVNIVTLSFVIEHEQRNALLNDWKTGGWNQHAVSIDNALV